MFRAEVHQFTSGPVLKMEGKLAGEWAEAAKSLVMRTSVPTGLIVDVTDVSYIDSVGERMLSWLSSIGAVFIANAVYAAAICERLHLPLAQEH